MEDGPAHRRAAQLGLEVIDGGQPLVVETRSATPIIPTDRPQPGGRLPDRIVYERPD